MKIDTKIEFEEHIEHCVKRKSQNHCSGKNMILYNILAEKIIVNSFVISHFPYCPIVWIIHSRRLNNCIIKKHKRALRLVYQGYTTSFTDLLAKIML